MDNRTLAQIDEIAWDNLIPCQICGDLEYTRVVIRMSGSVQVCICPFCMALAIDRATGWKVWAVMSSWENTRKIHQGIQAMKGPPRPSASRTGGESTP